MRIIQAKGFGLRLRIWRFTLGVSEEQVARLLGVTQGYVSHFESGRRPPTLALREKIKVLMALDKQLLYNMTNGEPIN